MTLQRNLSCVGNSVNEFDSHDAIHKVLKGVIKYRETERFEMVEQLEIIKNNPRVLGLSNFLAFWWDILLILIFSLRLSFSPVWTVEWWPQHSPKLSRAICLWCGMREIWFLKRIYMVWWIGGSFKIHIKKPTYTYLTRWYRIRS